MDKENINKIYQKISNVRYKAYALKELYTALSDNGTKDCPIDFYDLTCSTELILREIFKEANESCNQLADMNFVLPERAAEVTE